MGGTWWALLGVSQDTVARVDHMFLKKGTTANIVLGPFVDVGDGVVAETGLTLTTAIEVSKNAGAFAQRDTTAGAVSHSAEGWYTVPVDSNDTDTVGQLVLKAQDTTTYLPVWQRYFVVDEETWDAFFSDTPAAFDTAGQCVVGAIAADVVDNTAVADGTISAAKFASGAINATVVASGAIDAGAIASNAITDAKIASDAITSAKIADSSITDAKLSVSWTSADTTSVSADVVDWGGTAITTGSLPGFKKNTARTNFQFLMRDTSGDPATGLTGITEQRSLDSAAFAATTNNSSEIGNGLYSLDLSAADLNGDFVTLRFSHASAQTTLISIKTI